MLIKKERFHFAQEEEGQLMVDVTDRVNNRPIDGASVFHILRRRPAGYA